VSSSDIAKFADGELYFWLEEGNSIQLKAVSPLGDPVELTFQEAREIADRLLEMVRKAEESER
jgi:hypothetical protein